MQARIKSQTVFRLQSLTDRPLLRGIDLAINECLDRLEKLEKPRKKGDKKKMNSVSTKFGD